MRVIYRFSYAGQEAISNGFPPRSSAYLKALSSAALYNCHPAEYFTILETENPRIDAFDLHKIRRSTDFGAIPTIVKNLVGMYRQKQQPK